MPIYETVFVLDTQLEDSARDKRIQGVLDFLSRHAERVIKTDRWGNRHLAYEIKKRQQGHYVSVQYETSPAVIPELERIFRLDDAVLRYLTMRSEEKIKEEEQITAKEEINRAVQEGKESEEGQEGA
ncbi:MAG: 30S ribosomal protein S6 [Candidatus Latescibacteria bacterium]|nr:30S ribosomal protein S6 [Candidatus Latescibacterota bacterium]